MKTISIIWSLKPTALSQFCKRGHHVWAFDPTKSTTALQEHLKDFFHRLAAPCIVNEKPGKRIHSTHVPQNSNIQICCDRYSGISRGSMPKPTCPTDRHHCTPHPSAENSKVLSGSKPPGCTQGWRLKELAGVHVRFLSSTIEMLWWLGKEAKVQRLYSPSKGQCLRNDTLVRQFSARENHGRSPVGAQLSVHKIASIGWPWVNHVSLRWSPFVITHMFLWLSGEVWMSFALTIAWFLSPSPTVFFCVGLLWSGWVRQEKNGKKPWIILFKKGWCQKIHYLLTGKKTAPTAASSQWPGDKGHTCHVYRWSKLQGTSWCLWQQIFCPEELTPVWRSG